MTHTDTQADARADIAWMRNLAQEGADAPFRGGSVLFAAGLVFGAASLMQWAMATGIFPMSPLAAPILWLGTVAIFLLIVFTRRIRTGCGPTTAANRASAAVWSAVGWGVFAFCAAVAAVGARLQSGEIVAAMIPSGVLVLYGMGWAVTAAMHRSRLLGGLAAASFIAAPLLGLLSGDARQLLAYAAALFLLATAPGWVMMRRARQAASA